MMVMAMILFAVLECPLLIIFAIRFMGVNVGTREEVIGVDGSSSESVSPKLLYIIILESLIGHQKVFVNDQVSVEPFEEDGLRMEKGFHGVFLTIVHELLGELISFSTAVWGDANVEETVIFWIVFVASCNFEG